MSKSRIGMAAAGVAMVALGALPSAAEAGFRLRVGGAVGVARFAMASMLSVAGLRHARMAARHSRVRTAALRPQDLRSGDELQSTRVRVRSSLPSRRWPAGRAAELRTAGGSTPTVHTAGSVRCSGRSPIAIFMTTRFSVTVAASGPMATAISTPRFLASASPAISQRSRPSALPGGGIAKRPPCRSSAALTPPR